MQESEVMDVLRVRDAVAKAINETAPTAHATSVEIAEHLMQRGFIDYAFVSTADVAPPAPAQTRKAKEKEILRASGVSEDDLDEAVEITRVFDAEPGLDEPLFGVWTRAEVDRLSTGQVHIEYRHAFGGSGTDKTMSERRKAIIGKPRSKHLAEFASTLTVHEDEPVEPKGY